MLRLQNINQLLLRKLQSCSKRKMVCELCMKMSLAWTNLITNRWIKNHFCLQLGQLNKSVDMIMFGIFYFRLIFWDFCGFLVTLLKVFPSIETNLKPMHMLNRKLTGEIRNRRPQSLYTDRGKTFSNSKAGWIVTLSSFNSG